MGHMVTITLFEELTSCFSKQYDMSLLEAYNYLDRYGGIAFLDECYAAEHLLSIEEALHDLIVICKNNGGGLI